MNAKRHLPVHFIRSLDSDGVECYFVMRLSPSSLARLTARKDRPDTDLTAYGEILESGYGHPTPSVCARLKEQYGLVIAD